MICIKYEEKPEVTFRDYEIMIACYKGKKGDRLAKGKPVRTTTRNLKTLFFEGLLIVVLSCIVYLLSDKPIQGWDAVFFYGLGVIGVLYMILAAATPAWLRKQFEKALAKSIKGDIVFDAAGVHVWENPEKGFDQSWDQLTDCFISCEHIFVFFQSGNYVLNIRNAGDFEARVLEALRLGGREDIVIRFTLEKGKVRRLA